MRAPLDKITSALDSSGKPSSKSADAMAMTGVGGPSYILNSGLAKVTSAGKVETPHAFLINPESIEDSKSSNWAQHNIPGQRDPILQWTSGGPRVIAFDALVTKESSWHQYMETPNNTNAIGSALLNAVGNLAGAFFGVSLPPLSDLLTSANLGPLNRLSIENELAYYRSLLLPTYDMGILTRSPPLVVLYFSTALQDSSLIYDFGLSEGESITATTPVWVLTNLKVKITKFLKNIRPMEAVVSFQFTQYVIANESQAALTGPPISASGL